MSGAYAPLLILIGVSVANAIFMIAVSHIASYGIRRPTPQKGMPYESGMIPLGSTRERFSVKGYGPDRPICNEKDLAAEGVDLEACRAMNRTTRLAIFSR